MDLVELSIFTGGQTSARSTASSRFVENMTLESFVAGLSVEDILIHARSNSDSKQTQPQVNKQAQEQRQRAAADSSGRFGFRSAIDKQFRYQSKL